MTNREKKARKKTKKELQDKGILPPDKKKLNRKKFIEEARAEWNEKDSGCLIWDIYLMEAVSLMLGHTDKNFRVSPEAVGVAKCLKIAMRGREFHEKLKDEGRTKCTFKEYYDYIKDILEA